MNKCIIPCIVCNKELQNFQNNNENHPVLGLEFITHGHYGSTFFDPMDGAILVINICDDCIRKASEDKKVLHSVPETSVHRDRDLKIYKKAPE